MGTRGASVAPAPDRGRGTRRALGVLAMAVAFMSYGIAGSPRLWIEPPSTGLAGPGGPSRAGSDASSGDVGGDLPS